jgi:hypothetical protein
MIIDSNYSIEVTKDSVNLKYVSEYVNDKGKTVKQKDNWYYPNIKLALKKYVYEASSHTTEISKIISKLEEIESTINNLKL